MENPLKALWRKVLSWLMSKIDGPTIDGPIIEPTKERRFRMRNEEKEINMLVRSAQESTDSGERKTLVGRILNMLEPFRYALAKKFSSKGVDFDDIVQQIDLKLIEAIYDYDESLDPSALRHITSRSRNGIWNYYRKEMNYFDEAKTTVSLDIESLYIDGRSHGAREYFSRLERIPDNSLWDEEMLVQKMSIEKELDKLTPHQKRVLMMYFVEDRTQYDVAGELDITQANVSRALKRAIAQLKNNLTP